MDFENVKLLLNFTSEETFLTDESFSNHFISNSGLTLSTSGKFGNCANSSGAQFATIPASTDFDFGTGDFTIDFWTRIVDKTADQGFIGCYVSPPVGWAISRWDTTGIYFTANSAIILNGEDAGQWVNNTWYHVAIVRHGNVFRYYRDGVLKDETTYTGAINSSGTPVTIGKYRSTAPYMGGSIDALRVVKGEALWTSAFVPPTSQPVLGLPISGTLSDGARIVVLDENSEVETTSEKVAGAYTIYALPGTKTVVAIRSDGLGLGYQNIELS